MKIKRVKNLKRKILSLYIISFFLTFILSIIFFISSDVTDSLGFLIISIGFIIIYFISKYLYLTWLGKLQYLFTFIPFILVILISKSELYFNLSIYDLNNTLIEKMSVQDNQTYSISYYKITDSKNNTILELDLNDFDVIIEGGKIDIKDGKVGYKIDFKELNKNTTKCLIKDINSEKYKIFDESCEKMEDK